MQSSSLEQTNPSERSAGQDGDRTAAHPRTTDDHGQSLNKIAGRVAAQCLGCDWRLKELNTRLRENLSNFRAIEGSITDTLAQLTKAEQSAEYVRTDIPKLLEELERSHAVLQDLSDKLPRIRSRITSIQHAYGSGRKKAQELINDLIWLNTDFHERWRLIVFTSSAPVSWRWKVTLRLLLSLVVFAILWVTWLALSGVYRAHRQRLLWGERLLY